MAKRSLEQRRADNLRRAGVDPVTKKKDVGQPGFHLNTDPKVGQGGKSSVPRATTTPSGKVAAAQRAKAVADSPLKPTPTKKPPSKKNDASSSTQRISREEGIRRMADSLDISEPAAAEIMAGKAKKDLSPEAKKGVKNFRESLKTTPSGEVADAQRKQAVKDSPLKPTPTKAPRATKNMSTALPPGHFNEDTVRDTFGLSLTDPSVSRVSAGVYKISKAPERKPVSSRANLSEANIRSMDALKGSVDRRMSAGSKKPGTPRKLSMNPKQVARRKARGFPSGH